MAELDRTFTEELFTEVLESTPCIIVYSQQAFEYSKNYINSITQTAKDATNEELKKFSVPEEYPVGIDLAEALKNPGSDADMILRDGDRLIVPQYNGTVKINGAVMYANTVAYEKGKLYRRSRWLCCRRQQEPCLYHIYEW